MLSVDHVVHRLHDGAHDGSREGNVEPTFADARPSAVLVLLADGPAGAEVLLTRRTANLSKIGRAHV